MSRKDDYKEGYEEGKDNPSFGSDFYHNTSIFEDDSDKARRKGYNDAREDDDDDSGSDDNSGCFITTACVKAKGLGDTCFELETLRSFRDNYMLATALGKKFVNEYYAVAPSIVKKIDEQENSEEIYEEIYRNVRTAVFLVLTNQNYAAFDYYKNTVIALKEKYSSA